MSQCTLIVFLSLIISLSVGLSVYPSSVSSQAGSYSTDQAVSVLSVKDQSGTADDWNKYIEFSGTTVAFKGLLSFDLSGVNVNSISAFSLNVNYKGPQKSNQVWMFEWFNPSSNSYVTAGDNTNAPSWSWITLSFSGPNPISNFVSSGVLKIRLSSVTAGDNCDIDFVELSLTTTSSPTTKPSTPAPTTTTKPTTTPTSPTSAASSSGRICPSGKVWVPAPLTTFHIQYSGTIDYTRNVQMYDIDMFDSVTSAVSSNLHSRGIAVVCYFSSQYEDWRSDSSKFTSNILGNDLDGWAGEKWVDIRSSTLRAIMTSRMDLAVQKGCDAIDVDNVDGYTNNNGFSLTAADQLDFNKFLATQAHARGLGISLKNDLNQITSLVSYFDFAVNEQCNQYSECNLLTPFVTNGKAVFGIEYSGSASSFCPTMNTQKFTFTLKNLALDAPATDCCTYLSGGCTNSASHQCV